MAWTHVVLRSTSNFIARSRPKATLVLLLVLLVLLSAYGRLALAWLALLGPTRTGCLACQWLRVAGHKSKFTCAGPLSEVRRLCQITSPFLPSPPWCWCLSHAGASRRPMCDRHQHPFFFAHPNDIRVRVTGRNLNGK
jgi:hypothetical protein